MFNDRHLKKIGHTLVAVNTVFVSLAGLTGSPIKAKIALTHTSAINAINTYTITKTWLALWPWTTLTVSAPKPITALPYLQMT